MEQSELDNQILEIEENSIRIVLKYESLFSENKELDETNYLKKIAITDSDCSNLGIRIFQENIEINSVLISGISGGTWLSKETENDKGHSVKLKSDNLFLSLGSRLVSIKIPTLTINWKLEPDLAEIFEFYNLENDILVRGELQIHRISLNGEIKWSFGGSDIWVNIDGKPEVTILNDKIKLIDFNHDEYVIDFYGNSIIDRKTEPNMKVVQNNEKFIWWKFWK